MIGDLHPILHGRENCARAGTAARSFHPIDTLVGQRLRGLRIKRTGRQLHAGELERWTRGVCHALGLHRLCGTGRHPGGFVTSRRETSSVSRVWEDRTHGSNGRPASTRPFDGERLLNQ